MGILMDKELIFELIDKINTTSVSKFEYEEEGFKVKLEKNVNYVNTDVQKNITVPDIQPSTPVPVDKAVSDKVIKSPIVGTFYESTTPGGDALVSVGKTIKKGEVVCIIEAMKVMNEIESEFDGEVLEILVKNGEIVQYGQPLIVVK